jgi:hypothetical protein
VKLDGFGGPLRQASNVQYTKNARTHVQRKLFLGLLTHYRNAPPDWQSVGQSPLPRDGPAQERVDTFPVADHILRMSSAARWSSMATVLGFAPLNGQFARPIRRLNSVSDMD